MITGRNVFEKLTRLLAEIQNEKDREQLTLLASQLEALKGREGFKDKYMEFVSSAANHISILAPVLPILAGLGLTNNVGYALFSIIEDFPNSLIFNILFSVSKRSTLLREFANPIINSSC